MTPEQDVRALANDALSEEQMRHWPACRSNEMGLCEVHDELWPCHFGRLVDTVTVLLDAMDEANAAMLVARMHAAALGEVRGPLRGVVEDVEDVRLRAGLAGPPPPTAWWT